jgi:uncharacterized protein (TIGR02246 family)
MSVMRLRGVIITLGIVSTACPEGVTAQAVADSATLYEYVETYQRAMSTHDPTVVAAFFSEDADLVPGNLPALHGREAIEAWWRTYFERTETERRGIFDVTSTRFLTPDIALVNLAITSGGVDAEGEELQVRKARGTWLLRRHGNQWLIEAVRILPTEKDRVELMPSLAAAESLRPHLRAFVAAYEDTFNSHDPDALSAFYRDDADIIVREGPVIHGAQAIQEWWRDYFSQPRPYRALLIIEEIRMMSDNVALIDFTATGAVFGTEEQLLPVRRTRATWVVVREDGDWLIAALRVLPSEDDRVIREHE